VSVFRVGRRRPSSVVVERRIALLIVSLRGKRKLGKLAFRKLLVLFGRVRHLPNDDAFVSQRETNGHNGPLMRVPEVQWTGARLIAVLSLLGQQQQFHAFAFASQRGGPFFASPLVDPLQPLPNPLQPLPNPLQPRDPLSSFRHAMPGNCQSE